ncbi:MAG: DUF2207 domain-containing protein [Thermoanaerobaculia bacterium]
MAVLLALAVSPAFAKSLDWRSLDVTARLDKDGAIHVTERHAMVFDGDWNGGERTFRIGAGQGLNFESIARVDDSGVEHSLSSGEIDKVDHYSFTSPTVLRWRSRLPEDPPFDRKALTYVIRYTIDGVLQHSGDTYTLNHDFAFPDRTGIIDKFSLRFDLDPVWRGASSPIVINRKGLIPGEGVVVPLKLQYAGAGAPGGVVETLPMKFAWSVLAVLAIAIALLLFLFVSAERGKGRFARIVPPSKIDEAWLRENLLVLAPEVAGAAIDGETGAPEVAAMLARMTQEGKIASRVEERKSFLRLRQVLCLTLLADRSTLPSGEEKLVRAMFFSGDTTDTDAIQQHYSGAGFSPASIVEKSVKPALQRIKGWDAQSKRSSRWNLLWFALALVLLFGAAFTGGNNAGVALFVLLGGAILMGIAAAVGKSNSEAITGLAWRFAIPLILIAPLVWVAARYTLSSGRLVLHPVTPIALCLWALVAVKNTLDVMRTPESPERIAVRKRLLAARNYFIHELRSQQPRLRDDWYPYLLAFGLGTQVERWFGAFGKRSTSDQFAAARTSSSSTSSSSTSMASDSPAFTGGGGAFGGAGATGGWAVAAAAMAAGVASPSSSDSSSGSSSSSSSSSSGGGGGGGW